jgi:DNA repair exonuclease SbcCD ATPase subunit
MITKDNGYIMWESIVRPFTLNLDRIVYCHNPSYFELDGVSFQASPWTINTFSAFQPADVFIGHGAVVGSKDASGYAYKSGFPKSDLFNNFKLSVIGDIHRKQLFESEGRAIIVPGNLHCNTFNDSTEAGIFYIEMTDVVESEFIPNYKFEHSDLYYDFVRNKTPEEFGRHRPFTIFNSLPDKEDKKVELTEKSKLTTNLVELFKDLAEKNKFTSLIGLFEQLYEKSKDRFNEKTPFEVDLKEIKIKNFLSIENFELKFDNWTDLLITGLNGSGKSSVCEAIFFALTGRSTKNVDLDSLVKFNTDGFELNLTFQKDSDIITINRSRINKTSSVSITFNGNFYQKSSIAETQQYIYSLLGVSEDVLFMFCYFSANSYISFASLTNKDRYNILSELAITGKIDYLRNTLLEDIKEKKSKLSSLQFYSKQLTSDIASKDSLLKTLRESLSEEFPSVEILNKEILKLSDQVVVLSEKRSNINQRITEQSNKKKLNALLTKDISNLKSEVADLQKKKKSLDKHLCYTCNQPFDSKDEEQKIEIRIKEIIILAKSKKEELDNLKYTEANEEDFDSLRIIEKEIQHVKNESQDLKNKLSRASKVDREKSKVSFYSASVEEVSKTLADNEVLITEVNNELDELKSLEKLLARDGILSNYLLENTCNIINNELSYLLDGSEFSIKLVADKEIKVLVSINNLKEKEYNSLSSGEKKIVEISLIIAFINSYCNIFSLNKGLLGYIFLDEICVYVDSNRLNLVIELLSKCKSNKIVITHENNLKVQFNHKINVEKVNGNSEFKFLGV